MADRLGRGEKLPASARAMGIRSEFRARKIADQTRAWTVGELESALEGLLELDAMVKRAPDAIVGDQQRRLAWVLWVDDRVRRGVTGVSPGSG
jgi:hypothetical protein